MSAQSKIRGVLTVDPVRGVAYFHAEDGGCHLRIEGLPPVPAGHQIDIHLVAPGNEHHHRNPQAAFVDGAICAVKLPECAGSP